MKVASGVERIPVGVTEAVLHVVLKARVKETKILGNGILTVSNILESVIVAVP